jgi:23S rRNA (cytosine1962-C5)-methyltransferase
MIDSAHAEPPTVTLKIDRRSSHPRIFQQIVEKPAARIPPGSQTTYQTP